MEKNNKVLSFVGIASMILGIMLPVLGVPKAGLFFILIAAGIFWYYITLILINQSNRPHRHYHYDKEPEPEQKQPQNVTQGTEYNYENETGQRYQVRKITKWHQ